MSTDANLETMEPAADWDETAHEDVVECLSEAGLSFHVWGGDWCPDCREQLPAFAAALESAGVPAERITVYPVERTEEGKTGPDMEARGVERIPTVIVERDGTEVARFVERSALPIPVALARELRGEETGID